MRQRAQNSFFQIVFHLDETLLLPKGYGVQQEVGHHTLAAIGAGPVVHWSLARAICVRILELTLARCQRRRKY